ncbi:hypothetical protein [Parapedomonas caeni]
MRVGLVLVGIALTLSGCSSVRGAFGAVSDLFGANDRGELAYQNTGQGNPEAVAPRATDGKPIKDIARDMPRGLIGDAANSAHASEAIAPQ